jgi:excisionase family DNA binding protein
VTIEIVGRSYWESIPELFVVLGAAFVEDEGASSEAYEISLTPDEERIVDERLREVRLTLSVEEAAKALGISRALAYDAVRKGQIPSIRIGRRVLIPKKQLEELLRVAKALPDTNG